MNVSYSHLVSKLEEFSNAENKEDNSDLKFIIQYIAETGNNCFNWEHLKNALAFLIDKEIIPDAFEEDKREFPEDDSFESARSRILSTLNLFPEAPFTLQRICELLNDPQRHYKHLRKVMDNLEKLINVSSTLAREEPPNEINLPSQESKQHSNDQEQEQREISTTKENQSSRDTSMEDADLHHDHDQQQEQQQKEAEHPNEDSKEEHKDNDGDNNNNDNNESDAGKIDSSGEGNENDNSNDDQQVEDMEH
eukprot:gb/GECH01013960.1/.p1 GENE.gb/GECH01013960.1/~~gb/GECH01013960.1/.p1  ORF type:complete len:251 (+),score=101.79 gb/GECH01013960.1/:1-753(+)